MQGSNRNETTILNHPTHFFRGHGSTGLLKGWQCGEIKAVREGWGCCFRFRLERTNRYSAENFCSLTTHTEKENDKPREWEGKRWRERRSRLETLYSFACGSVSSFSFESDLEELNFLYSLLPLPKKKRPLGMTHHATDVLSHSLLENQNPKRCTSQFWKQINTLKQHLLDKIMWEPVKVKPLTYIYFKSPNML